MKQTSREAYRHIALSGKRIPLKLKVLEFAERNSNFTQLDISSTFGESARKRISEILKDRVIKETGTKTIGKLRYTTYALCEMAE